MSRTSFYSPYVPVATRRQQARTKMQSLEKKGLKIEPLGELSHRLKIATSFWGRGWCDHLESYSDYSNRLPRGRTYVRNGSVVHLSIKPGVIDAYVQGSELYKLHIKIKPLPASKWETLQARCRGKIGSLIELLQGKISSEIMTIVTDKDEGLFPHPDEIELNCSCPDWAGMCKHIAAVLYGVGARLDQHPELLFTLRGVDHNDLISQTDSLETFESPASTGRKRRRIDTGSLGDVFGIELDSSEEPPSPPVSSKAPKKTKAVSKNPAKPPPVKPFIPTAALVRKLRKQSGLSKYAFAREVGVSAPAIAVWENRKGKLKLNARSLERLRRYYETMQEKDT
ncbi:MAG: helix-turn-helix domain-containing protein [Kiritimatiellia bacterium]